MQRDWIRLMDAIGEPRARLPKLVNPSVTLPDTPPTVFDEEAREIIHRIDKNMFAPVGEFGYQRREYTFELADRPSAIPPRITEEPALGPAVVANESQ